MRLLDQLAAQGKSETCELCVAFADRVYGPRVATGRFALDGARASELFPTQ